MVDVNFFISGIMQRVPKLFFRRISALFMKNKVFLQEMNTFPGYNRDEYSREGRAGPQPGGLKIRERRDIYGRLV